MAEAARLGDRISLDILERASLLLVEHVATLHAGTEWKEIEPIITYVGGVFAMGDLILAPFTEHLAQVIPSGRYRLKQPRISPAEGAAHKARRGSIN